MFTNTTTAVPTTFVAPVDFVSGRAVRLYKRVVLDDDTVQAWCLWLTSHGNPEAAERLLEEYCAGTLRVH